MTAKGGLVMILGLMPLQVLLQIMVSSIAYSCPSTTMSTSRSRNALITTHPYAVQRAEFALRVLQSLSDTGIFRTLSLKRISNAATEDGVFHFNTLLTLELASPYFASGLQAEEFEVVVMENKDDGHVRYSDQVKVCWKPTSYEVPGTLVVSGYDGNSRQRTCIMNKDVFDFSIDSFPDMDAKAMEDFYIQQVEQHRQGRELFWLKAEREADGDAWAEANMGTSDPGRLAVDMMTMHTDDLLSIVEGGMRLGSENPVKETAKNELERRWEQPITSRPEE